MAYMNQEKKAKIAAKLKEVVPPGTASSGVGCPATSRKLGKRSRTWAPSPLAIVKQYIANPQKQGER